MTATSGCANINIEEVEAAPVDFFIGNTNPNLKEEKVKILLLAPDFWLQTQ